MLFSVYELLGVSNGYLIFSLYTQMPVSWREDGAENN